MSEVILAGAAAIVAWAKHEDGIISVLTFLGTLLAIFGVCGVVSLALTPGRLDGEQRAALAAASRVIDLTTVSREKLEGLAHARMRGWDLLVLLDPPEACPLIEPWMTKFGLWLESAMTAAQRVSGPGGRVRLAVPVPHNPECAFTTREARTMMIDLLRIIDEILRDTSHPL